MGLLRENTFQNVLEVASREAIMPETALHKYPHWLHITLNFEMEHQVSAVSG